MKIAKELSRCKRLCVFVVFALLFFSVSVWFFGQDNVAESVAFGKYKSRSASRVYRQRHSVPHIDDKFPWGADFRLIDRRYRHLSRSWSGLKGLELSRVEQYITDVPCKNVALRDGKIRVYFRLKSHMLYEVQFEYIGRCVSLYRQVSKKLIDTYGKPSANNSSSLPKGKIFVGRSLIDMLWHEKEMDINLRRRIDFFKGIGKVESLFVTFRASDYALSSKHGPSGEQSREQLLKDSQIRAGGDIVSFMFFGEIRPGKDQVDALVAKNKIDDVFVGIKKQTQKSTVAVASLLSTMGPYDSAVGAEFVGALISSGISVVFLPGASWQNRHEELSTTVRILEASNIKTVIPGGDYTIVKAGDLRVVFVAYSFSDEKRYSLGSVLRMVQGNVALLSAKFDAVVVGVDWTSKQPYCAPEIVRRVAETSLASGASIVWGYGNGALCGMMKFSKGVAFFGGGVMLSASKKKDPEGISVRARLNASGLIDYQLLPLVALPYPNFVGSPIYDHIIMRFRLLSQNCIRRAIPENALKPFGKYGNLKR